MTKAADNLTLAGNWSPDDSKGKGERVLIVSVAPLTSPVTVGRVPRPGDVVRPGITTAADTQTTGAIGGSLNSVIRPLLDPATQLAAQDARDNRQESATGQNSGDRQGAANPLDLTDEEKAEVRKLRQTDAEVRRHEQAHAMAGGRYAGTPSYDYVQGPDGGRYAVGGEVSIDASPARDPDATIQKMEIVIRAALAPANPSAQDHAIANKARQTKAEAVAEKRAERLDETRGEDGGPAWPSGTGALADRTASLYERIAGLISEPLGLVAPQTSVEIVA